MPAIRDFTQNYTATTTAGLVCSAPDYSQNDLLVSMVSADTSADPMYWVVGEPATYVFMWDNSAGTFTDYTTNFNSAATADWYMFTASPGTTEDACYFGRSAQFNGLAVIVSTASSVVHTWAWEYYNGSAWTTLTTLNNQIVTNMAVGYRSLAFNPPPDWASNAINSQTQYWIRMRLTAYTSTTTRPVLSQGWLGTFAQIGHVINGTTSGLAVGYKIAGASEPIEYGVAQAMATNDTFDAMVVSIRDIDTSLPFAHETSAALSNAYTTQDSGVSLYSGSTIRVAQSFAMSTIRYTLASVKFYLKKTGSPTGNATAKLYTHSGTFGTTSVGTTPTLAASATYDVSALTTSYQLIEFVFPWYQNFILQPSTNYVIGIEYSGGDASNNIQVGYDNSSPAHAGNATTYVSSWTAQAYDLVFYTYYWAYGRSTSSSARVALPTMTTERDNSLILYIGTEAAVAVPSIIEGPTTLIVAKDSTGHADGMSWGFQKTAGTTPANVYMTALGTSWAKALGTFTVNPPASGATVIPAYCASDSSVYISPSTGAAFTGARSADAAPVVTATTYFGSTLNGKTLTSSTTTVTYADTGVNSYHAMRAVQGVVTANTWAGNVAVMGSADLSGRNILFHIQPYIPVDIQTTDSVALTGACGVAIGFASTANTHYKVWHVGGANTPFGVMRHQPVVIHSSYVGAGMIQNTGTLVPSAVVDLGFFVSGKVVVPDWLMGSIWALDTTVVVGGNAAEPLKIPGIVQAAADGHERKSVVQQGSAQFMVYQPLQIGDGGTNATYLQLDGTALEFPKQYNKDAKTVNYCSIDNVAGLKYYAGSGDTIIHKNSIISSTSRYHWGLHASFNATVTPDFSGLSVIGAGTITLANAVTITGLTINDYSTITASGLTLINGIITTVPATSGSITIDANSTFTGCSINVTTVTAGNYWVSTVTPNKFTSCTFTGTTGTGHAMMLDTGASGGTFALAGNTFTGFGADGSTSAAIYNNSGGAVTLNISGGVASPTVRNGSGATTTVNNNVTVTVTIYDQAGDPIPGVEVSIFRNNTARTVVLASTVTNDLGVVSTTSASSLGAIIIRARQSTKTATFLTSAIATNIITTVANHNFKSGDAVTYSRDGGSVDIGPEPGTYYAGYVGVGTLYLYDTAANAIAGGATGRQTLTASGSETHLLDPVRYVATSAAGSIGTGNYSSQITMITDNIATG